MEWPEGVRIKGGHFKNGQTQAYIQAEPKEPQRERGLKTPGEEVMITFHNTGNIFKSHF